MICEKCNNQIDDDSKFCSLCGNKIEKKVEEVEIDKLEDNTSHELKFLKNEELRDLSEHQKGMGFYDFYLNYKGSIGRKEFFFRGFLPLSILNLVLLIAVKITSNLELYNNFYGFLKYVIFVISLFVFVIVSNITIKRLHDMDSKSWFFVWNLVPFVNIFLLLSLISTPSSKIRNHGETNYYKLNTKKVVFSIFNICIIVVLVFTFSFLNILLKGYVKSNAISIQNEILLPFKNFEHEKLGFVNKKGDWIINPKFESANIFYDDLAIVKFNGKYGFIITPPPNNLKNQQAYFTLGC